MGDDCCRHKGAFFFVRLLLVDKRPSTCHKWRWRPTSRRMTTLRVAAPWMLNMTTAKRNPRGKTHLMTSAPLRGLRSTKRDLACLLTVQTARTFSLDLESIPCDDDSKSKALFKCKLVLLES